MKIFNFFVRKIFLKKVILFIVIFVLFFMANYTIFVALHYNLLTYKGFQEINKINEEGNYIANLSPTSDSDMDKIVNNGTQVVYDYLNTNFSYAFYTDGFMISLPNKYNMDIPLSYMNEKYYNLRRFEVSKGKGLDFDYQLDKGIPVLIGKGLHETYPVSSIIEIYEPVLEKKVKLKVEGVLKENESHSNFYAPNSKQYYNFSIFVPINEKFMKQVNADLRLNGLMDVILLQTTREKTEDFINIIQEKLGLNFRFYSKQENDNYFKEYYKDSLKTISIVTITLLIIIICLSLFNALMSIRVMIKDFTINLLVGLSYSRLRKVFYTYYGMISLFNLIILFIITTYTRYGYWLRKEYYISTYGVFGLMNTDWICLLAVAFFDLVIASIMVEIILFNIKKIPISMGAL